MSGAFDTATGPNPNAYNQIVGLADGKLSQIPSATPVPNASVPGSSTTTRPTTWPCHTCRTCTPGAALLDLPGTPSGSVQEAPFIASGATWPAYTPVLLELKEGTTAPSFQPGTNGREGVLTVYIPKGQVAPVQLSSYLNAGDLASMGQWQWIVDSSAFATSEMASLQAMATSGQMWALTLFRELILVHAVRQPLATPEFSSSFTGLKTEFGQTWAELIDTMSWDRSSTSKVHVTANWVEWVDAGPAGPPPTQVPPPGHTLPPTSGAIAFDVNLTAGDLQPKPLDSRQGAQLMQTLLQDRLVVAMPYSQITVPYLPQPVANGAAIILYYSGYEQEVTVNNPGGYPANNNPVTIQVDPFTANYSYPVIGDSLPLPATGTVNFPGTVVYDPVWNATTLPLFQRHDFKDTKHRNVIYQAEATTAFAEYFYETDTVTVSNSGPTQVNANGFVPGTVTVAGLPGAAPTSQNLNGVSFVDGSHGWAAGNDGVTLVTYNGGNTWYPLSVGTTAAINAVSFSPRQHRLPGRPEPGCSSPPPTAGKPGRPSPTPPPPSRGSGSRTSRSSLLSVGGSAGRRHLHDHQRRFELEPSNQRHQRQPVWGLVHQLDHRLGGRCRRHRSHDHQRRLHLECPAGADRGGPPRCVVRRRDPRVGW